MIDETRYELMITVSPMLGDEGGREERKDVEKREGGSEQLG